VQVTRAEPEFPERGCVAWLTLCAGVGALAATLNLIQTAGGKLILLSVQPRVLSLLARMRLNQFFTITDDRTSAFTKS